MKIIFHLARIFVLFKFYMKKFFLLLIILLTGCRSRTTVYIAPDGDDRASGSRMHPLATLAEAFRRVDQNKRIHTVYLRGGLYRIDSPLVLKGISRLHLTAYKNEKVTLIGGRFITGWKQLDSMAPDYMKFNPTARRHIWMARLSGIDSVPVLRPHGFAMPVTTPGMRLYYHGIPMPLARWPDTGWVHVQEIPPGFEGKTFRYNGHRPSGWSRKENIWMHGYWKWDWADAMVQVARIDTVRRLITVADPQSKYGYVPGGRFYFLNVPEELDRPGEWYVNKAKGWVYFYPPSSGWDTSAVVLSLLPKWMLTLDRCSHVQIEGLRMHYGRHGAVRITGGHHNALVDCHISGFGTSAVRIEDAPSHPGEDILARGMHNGVDHCVISYCGEGGVVINGGDRKTLKGGGHYVKYCDLSYTAMRTRTYRPAVYLRGVGHQVLHNEIHHLPHAAIIFRGNDHYIAYNEIYRVCTETSDAGAIYTGRDWTACGHKIRYNFLHDIHPLAVDGRHGFKAVVGVYLDDMASGIQVYGNIFENVDLGVLLGGGRSDTVANNVFVRCRTAVRLDARGLTWARHFADSGGILRRRYQAVRAGEPPYTIRYPFLKNLLQRYPAWPLDNCIRDNVCCLASCLQIDHPQVDSVLCRRANRKVEKCTFYRRQGHKVVLHLNDSVWPAHFRPIPTGRIGRGE